MVYFLVKKEDEMLRNYDPTTADDSLRTTIVAKLEHYGAELMKILDEGKDAGMGPEKQDAVHLLCLTVCVNIFSHAGVANSAR